MSSTTADILRCSFCGQPHGKVKKLIAGPSVYICDECIAICNEIISDDKQTEGASAEKNIAADAARAIAPSPAVAAVDALVEQAGQSFHVTEMLRQRGFAQRVGFGERPALLIVDFIRAFTHSPSPLAANFDCEIAATGKLLNLARKLNVPIHFTTTAYNENFADAGVFIKKIPSLSVLRAGSAATEVDARLTPLAGERIWIKKFASAFFGTDLAAAVRAAQVDTLIVTGCTTSGCVRASAVDACQHGFRTIVVREAVGDRLAEAHEANLFDLDAKYADVVSLDETLRYLETCAVHK